MPSPRRKKVLFLLLLSGVALFAAALAWWPKASRQPVVLTVLGYTTNELTQELATNLPDRFVIVIIGVTNCGKDTFTYWDYGGKRVDYAVLQKGAVGWQDTGFGSGSCGLSAKSRTLLPGQGFTFEALIHSAQPSKVLFSYSDGREDSIWQRLRRRLPDWLTGPLPDEMASATTDVIEVNATQTTRP